VKVSSLEPVVRRVANQFARCVADTRGNWAQQLLELPFTSESQIKQLHDRLGGWDDCLATYQFNLKLNEVSLLGGMAEKLTIKRFKAGDSSRFGSVTDDQLFASAAAPRNTSEDFAMCLVRKNPRAVRALIEAVPTSGEETASLNQLIPHLSTCVPSGMNLKLNAGTIRSYSAYGLYRLHLKYPSAVQNTEGR